MTLDVNSANDIKAAIAASHNKSAFALLRHSLVPEAPFIEQARAVRLFRSIAPASLGLRTLRVAIVASSTVDHLSDVLRYWLATVGFAAEIYIAPFDMIVQTVFDQNSELYTFKPDLVWIFTGHRDLRLQVPGGAEDTAIQQIIDSAINRNRQLWGMILSQLNCSILQNNVDIPADDPFGNMAGSAPWGQRNIARMFNAKLGAALPPGVVIFDLDHISAEYGKRRWFDERYWFHSKHAFSLDAIGIVANAAARITAGAKGLSKKCLVLDLDNTVWGGVIGDDGLEGIKLGAKADGEAFMAFQSYVLALKERGVILAVCSKNDEANAKEPFEKHPDMRLRLDDIAAFRANWNNKVDNIRDIAAILNIGLDSLVFVDDNPAERAIVRQFLPMVEVPELPEDPSGYIDAIASRRYFELISFSDEDRERARYYQENAQRAELQMSFQDTATYLESLGMSGEIGSLDALHLPRMAQLINKSNQFHLTGTRYSEADLNTLAGRPDYVIRYFKLRDRFGDNGLISVLILKIAGQTLHVDTWVMSCRVLARTMEEFIANEIVSVAHEYNCHDVVGIYRPTTKNKLVSGLYQKLGFAKLKDVGQDAFWRIELDSAVSSLTTYVKRAL